MKKRRNLIISLLLIAAMVVGIGYANLARELTVSSTADISVNQDNFEVLFQSEESTYGMKNVTLHDADVTGDALATMSVNADRTKASYTIKGLTNINDTLTLYYTVKNETTDVKAQLTQISSVPGTLYIGEGTAQQGQVSTYFSKEIKIVKGGQNYQFGADQEGGTVDVLDTNNLITLAPNETLTVEIKITMNKTVGSDGESMITLAGAMVYLNFHPYVAP